MAHFHARELGTVEFPDERRRHILARHPEVRRYLRELPRVLADPETIRRSRHDPNVLLYYRRVRPTLYLTAVVKTNARKFILTLYLTERIAHPSTLL